LHAQSVLSRIPRSTRLPHMQEIGSKARELPEQIKL
jgi:hypothetical protein